MLRRLLNFPLRDPAQLQAVVTPYGEKRGDNAIEMDDPDRAHADVQAIAF